MARGGLAVVVYAAAHFKTTGDFLGMISLHPATERKVWWTSEDEVKLLPDRKDRRITEVPPAKIEAIELVEVSSPF